MSCITTYTKHRIDPTNARPDDIDIQDIAHALSLLCRAGGHFPTFYSVAQHCLNCATEASARGYSRRVQAGCLLHDAGEAYLADVTRPVKAQLPTYRDIEDKLLKQILDTYISPALTEEELKQIYAVDDALLYHEFLSLMEQRLFSEEPVLLSHPDLSELPFKTVEQQYLSRFRSLTRKTSSFTVGVDWMSGCWLAAQWQDGHATCRTYEDVAALCAAYPNVAEILIDVPIGLPSTAADADNRPDRAARKYLKKHHSSVFPTPLRPVVYADTTADMWNINRSLGGSLSVAGTGILPIIRQVDTFLQDTPSWRYRLVESHPECAFQALNGGNGLEYSKHDKDGKGILQRIRILTPYVQNLDTLLSAYTKEQQKDVLDALVLAVTSHLGHHPINDTVIPDSLGLPMRIVIPDI